MSISSQLAASRLIQPGVIPNSAARPASPFQGQCIYQADTNELLVWNGTAWISNILADSANRVNFPASVTVVTETPTGRGLGIRGSTGNTTPPILQFINNAGTVQLASLQATAAGELTVNARILNTSVNIAQGSQYTTIVNTATPTPIASVNLTVRGGRPVLLMGSGDANPTSNSNAWNYLGFFRGSTQIGPFMIQQATGSSNNQAFGIVALDYPSAGTYTYNLCAWNGDGPFQYGETGAGQAPVIIALELL